MSTSIKPFVIFLEGEYQDMLLCGPDQWLESAKATASILYEGQPNPRNLHTSSFSVGRHLGFNLFARSYHVDTEEAGSQRRGGLLTLGLASSALPVNTLAWTYHLGFLAFAPSLLSGDETTGITFEDQIIEKASKEHGPLVGQKFAAAMQTVFSLGVNPPASLPGLPIRPTARLGSHGALLLEPNAGRDVLYVLALELLKARTGRSPAWFRRTKLATALISRLSSSSEPGILIFRSEDAADGLVEISMDQFNTPDFR